MARAPAYDTQWFQNVEEENAYIRRQIAQLVDIHDCQVDDVGWIAFKMGISRAIARRKIARATAQHT